MANIRLPDPASSPALAPPPHNARFPLLDSCRGAAAVAIVLSHTSGLTHGELGNLADELRDAVPVFFALSGFLLFRPYLVAQLHGSNPPRARDFFQRRALRILPGYWVALTIVALVLGSSYAPGAFSSRWWLYYGLGQAYSVGHNNGGLIVAWSLSVEVSFYLVLPLLAALSARLGRRLGWRWGALLVVVPLFVLGPLVRLAVTSSLDPHLVLGLEHITYGLPGWANFFALGMLLALASVDAEARGTARRGIEALASRPLLCWAGAAVAFVCAATVGGVLDDISFPIVGRLPFRTRFVANDLLTSITVPLLLIPAVFPRPGLPARVMAWRAAAFVGLISYGLYLWHQPLAAWLSSHPPLDQLGPASPVVYRPVLFAVTLLGGIAVASASYYLVELPFLRLKRGWRSSSRRRGPDAAGTAVERA